MVISLTNRASTTLRALAIRAWEHRVALSLVAAALAGWLAAVWFMAPEKQLQRLAETLDDTSEGLTQAQSKTLTDAYMALEEKFQSSSSARSVLVFKRGRCAVFCTLEWEVHVMSHDGKDWRHDDGLTVSVTAGLEPFPADARPSVTPVGYLWREKSWSWYVSRRRGVEGLDSTSAKGDFGSARPEVVLSGANEVSGLLNLMGTRMREALTRANDRNEVYKFKE